MTLLMPCNRCRRKNHCDLRETKRQQIKGCGLTVARFSCPIMKDDYRTGRRVEVRLLVHDYDESIEAAFLGTVMGWSNRKLLIHLDTGESIPSMPESAAYYTPYEANKRIVKSWPVYVIPLDEPDKPFCEKCRLPRGAVVEDWYCIACTLSPTPDTEAR